MKLSNVPAAVAAVASGITNSTTPAPAHAIFQVTNFTAACIPHSAECSYNFRVYQPGSYEAYLNGSVACNALVLSPNGTLPTVIDAPCTDSGRTFTVAPNPEAGNTLFLTVSQPVTPSSNQTGKSQLPPYWIEYQQTGASRQQVWTGPSEFSLV